MTVNSNNIPIGGVDRVEILKDGASAIYGADAVAGVVNTVLKKDFEGFQHKALDLLPMIIFQRKTIRFQLNLEQI